MNQKHSTHPSRPLPQAIFFDYDGVLVASEPIHLLAWKQLLIELNLPADTPLIEAQIGKTAPQILETLLARHLPDWQTQKGWQLETLALRKNDFYLQMARTQLQPYPGVKDGLTWLQRQGVRMAVVSNGKSRELNTTLELLGLKAFFELILSRDDVFPNKPDPTPYRMAAQKLGVPIAEGMAVEDSPTGLSAALLSGLPSVGIAHAFTPEQLQNPVPGRPELSPLRVEKSMVGFFEFLKARALSLISPSRG